jgi:hypothetical protein
MARVIVRGDGQGETMSEAETLALETQKAWDAGEATIRGEILRGIPGLSIDQANGRAGILAIARMGSRPKVGHDILGDVMTYATPLVFLLSVLGPLGVLSSVPKVKDVLAQLLKGLKAAGIAAPGSLTTSMPGILAGALTGVVGMDDIKNIREQVRIAIAVLQEVDKGLDDGKLDIKEIVAAAMGGFAELNDGDTPAKPAV